MHVLTPRRHPRPGYAKVSPRLAVLGGRSFSEGGRRVTRFSRDSNVRREAAACWADSPGPSRAMTLQAQSDGDLHHGRRRHSPASTKREQASAAARGQIGNVWKRECRQYPGLRRTRASANTSGPDSTLARRPLVKLRSSLRRTAPNEENSFLLPDCEREQSDR